MSEKNQEAVDLRNLRAFKGRQPVKILDGDSDAVLFEGVMQSMSGADREDFYADSMESQKQASGGETFPRGLQARTICRCLVDSSGNRPKPETIQALDAQTIDVLFEESLRVSGLNKKPEEAESDAKKD